jgi:hypothetical protein
MFPYKKRVVVYMQGLVPVRQGSPEEGPPEGVNQCRAGIEFSSTRWIWFLQNHLQKVLVFTLLFFYKFLHPGKVSLFLKTKVILTMPVLINLRTADYHLKILTNLLLLLFFQIKKS